MVSQLWEGHIAQRQLTNWKRWIFKVEAADMIVVFLVGLFLGAAIACGLMALLIVGSEEEYHVRRRH